MKIKENIDVIVKHELEKITDEYLDLTKDFIKQSYKLLSRKREYEHFCLDSFSKSNETYFEERENFINSCNSKEAQDKCRQLTFVEADLGEYLRGCVPSNTIIDIAKNILLKNPDCESIHSLVSTLNMVVDDFIDVFLSLLFTSSYKDTYSFNEKGNLVLNKIQNYSFDHKTFTLKRNNKDIASVSYIEADKEIITYEFHTKDPVDLYYIHFYFTDLLLLYMHFQRIKLRTSELKAASDELYQTYMECKRK